MDYISVKDFEVYGYHGVLEGEKIQGQIFLISFDAYLNLQSAGISDALDMSVSYADMCYAIEHFVKHERFDLIEAVAEGIAKVLLLTFPLIDNVKVIVKKPHAPIGRPLKYAAVGIDRGWHKVYLSIGSNMGDSEAIIRGAMNQLGQHEDIQIIQSSKLIVTEPWGVLDQPKFLNGVIEIKTLLTPKALMTTLLEIEALFDRERTLRWGPRTLDIDILLYDEVISGDPEVILPHPRMEERLFVLEPLAEIAPYALHPILNQRVINLLEHLKKKLD